MFTKRGIDKALYSSLPHSYSSCKYKNSPAWSCFIIQIKGKHFGKFNLCFYKNISGKYRLTDGGFIFNNMIKGKTSAEDMMPEINTYLMNNFHISFIANGNLVLFKVHNSYNSLVSGVAAFFILLTMLINSVDAHK